MNKFVLANIVFLAIIIMTSTFCFAQEVVSSSQSSGQSSVDIQQSQSSSQAEPIKRKPLLSKKAFNDQEMPDITPTVSRMGKGLLYTLAVLLVVLAVVKKLYGNKFSEVAGDAVKIISKRQIGVRSCLFIVKAEDQKFLLAQCGDEITLLSELDSLGQVSCASNELESDKSKEG